MQSLWTTVRRFLKKLGIKTTKWPSNPTTGHAAAKSLQSCPTLCDPMDSSLPDSPVPGILQARTLEWVAISFSNAWKWSEIAQSYLNLGDPIDCSLPGSSIHGIFQARVLEWGATAFSDYWAYTWKKHNWKRCMYSSVHCSTIYNN